MSGTLICVCVASSFSTTMPHMSRSTLCKETRCSPEELHEYSAMRLGVAHYQRARVSQVLVAGSVYQGAILVSFLEPQPNVVQHQHCARDTAPDAQGTKAAHCMIACHSVKRIERRVNMHGQQNIPRDV